LIVAIDTLFLSKRYRYTGTAVYLYHLLSECLKIAATAAPGMEFRGFMAPNDIWMDSRLDSPLLSVRRTRALAIGRLWRLGGMAISTSLMRPDLVFMPTGQSSIPGPFPPVVTTILDGMSGRLSPELIGANTFYHYLTRISAKLSRRVITISSWSKKDLVEIYSLDPDIVDVIYLGYDKGLYNDGNIDSEACSALLSRLGIRRPFILHHGMVQLRKNLVRLIRAWDLVTQSREDFGTQLVLAGPLGHGHEEILKAREASPKREHIILTGELPGADLSMLIKSASLCVIPSLYEGFCLPMIESMACGVPTVASNASCIPEVSGGVLEYFDPYSVEEMADVIRRTLEDSSLRDRLRNRGLTRAAEFSWERCARETLYTFRETYERYGRRNSAGFVL
jgi:glycosyltransferase involved in cell wall biosynthesis